jgi:hypothetical protein
MKKIISRTAAVCALLMAGNAVAHIGIARENVFSLGEGTREYLEGSSASLGIQLPHDCSNANGDHFPTTDVVVIFPNADSLSSNFMTTARDGTVYGANAMMGIKARVSASWRKVKVVKGTVGEYYSHGSKTNDVRAVKWLRGVVDNDHYDNLEIKTKFPKIDPASCVGSLKIKVPSIQYCKNGYKIAWIGTEGSTLFPFGSSDPKLRLTETFTASFKVVRDLANNPLPASCAGVATEEEIRPSDADIDAFGGRQP